MSKGKTAENYFLGGCNCAQAVALAFAEEMKLEKELVSRLTIGFGGGIGRMREVCGAVSAMAFVISAIYNEDKGSIYKRIQEACGEFKKANGSIICRELLRLNITGADSPTPEQRTSEYYEKRPCSELVRMSADILNEYLKNNPA